MPVSTTHRPDDSPGHVSGTIRPIRNLRWYICGLLFFATTINYVDRQVLGILKPVLDSEYHLSQSDYGWIIFAFQAAYALMMPVVGRLIDWLGTRIGFIAAVLVWSIAAMGHAAARSAVQFGIARFVLGVGESSNFPAAFRTVADWFPQQERALAAGIFNSGSNIGALVAPLVVPWIALHYSWHAAFIFTGALGFVWLAAWMILYHQPEEHPRLAPEELAFITTGNRGETQAKIPWLRLLKTRRAWAFIVGKMLTDPVWWFYLYWTPDFLHRKYGLNISDIGLPLVVIYITSDIGSIGGGWLSSFLLGRGWSVSAARKLAMLVCGICTLAVLFVPYSRGNMWLTVALISIAASAHQGWSANLFTLVSDMFPRRAVASVVGLGGFWGAVAGTLAAPSIGKWLEWSHDSYAPLFYGAGAAYLIALAIIHWLAPKLEVLPAE